MWQTTRSRCTCLLSPEASNPVYQGIAQCVTLPACWAAYCFTTAVKACDAALITVVAGNQSLGMSWVGIYSVMQFRDTKYLVKSKNYSNIYYSSIWKDLLMSAQCYHYLLNKYFQNSNNSVLTSPYLILYKWLWVTIASSGFVFVIIEYMQWLYQNSLEMTFSITVEHRYILVWVTLDYSQI